MAEKITHSPKLREAIEKIRAIYKEYDIAGVAYLHTPGFGEYSLFIEPSYSLAFIKVNEDKSAELRVKATFSQHKPGTPERAQLEMQAGDTANMFAILDNMQKENVQIFSALRKMIDQKLGATHPGPGRTEGTPLK